MTRTLFFPQNPHDSFDKIFEEFFGDVFDNKKSNGGKYPLTDIYEENGKVYMEIAVAGFSKDEIEITLENDVLSIKSNHTSEEYPERKYFKKDIAQRNFDKSYNIITPIENIDATYENGILKIELTPVKSLNKKEKILIK